MNRTQARERAAALVAKMTVEEKVSQMRYNAPAIDRLGIPAYNWWGEALHGLARGGSATSFPQAIGMAAAFDVELMERIGDAIATESRAKYNAYSAYDDRDIYKGLTLWSPNINIFRDPRWGRGQETYGEDPYLTGVLGCGFVRGLQGDGEYMKTAACAKHFAAHSGPEAIRHSFDVRVGEKDLRETYLPAFEMLVKEAKVETVMGTYNRVNGVPTSAHEQLMQHILRDEWQFEGHYTSDCWAVKDFHEGHHYTDGPVASSALAVNAGCDLNCGDTFLYLYDAYKQGLVSEERITEAVERLFTTRFLLGLFDETEYDGIPYSVVECPEHLALSEQTAAESIVLLKNDGILPLDRQKVRTIGVIGPNANSRVALIGNYHGTATEYITVLDGLLHACGEEIRVLYSEGCDIRKDRVENLAFAGDRLSEAMIVADNSDVVVLVTGLDEHLEGEEGDTGNSYASGDKADLLLPPPQRAMLSAVAETGKPVILVNLSGSAIDLSFAEENFGAVVQAWYPGARGGKVLAQILFGEISPSGKLPVTFYYDEDALPEFTDYSMQGRTYRYLADEPLYPFGYGLTYGDVVVTGAALGADVVNRNMPEEKGENGAGSACKGEKDAGMRTASAGKGILSEQAEACSDEAGKGIYSLHVCVENRAAVPTSDVIQVYVDAVDSSDKPDHPRLCGFARVHLEAGESKTVQVPLDKHTYTVIDQAGRRVSGGKHYVLYAGTGQPDQRTRELTGHESVIVEVTLAD